MAKMPVPLPSSSEPRDILSWAQSLTAWLEISESARYDIEESLAVGGPGMAERMFATEGIFTALASGTFSEMLGAPAAGKKRIITWISVTTDTSSTTIVASLVKKVASTEYVILADVLPKNDVFNGAGLVQIVLDGDDETFGLKVDTAGENWHYYLTYLDVD